MGQGRGREALGWRKEAQRPRHFPQSSWAFPPAPAPRPVGWGSWASAILLPSGTLPESPAAFPVTSWVGPRTSFKVNMWLLCSQTCFSKLFSHSPQPRGDLRSKEVLVVGVWVHFSPWDSCKPCSLRDQQRTLAAQWLFPPDRSSSLNPRGTHPLTSVQHCCGWTRGSPPCCPSPRTGGGTQPWGCLGDSNVK